MPSKIRILPEHVANMIAAGEVVSRPASVVKELVENALDAHATDVRVEVRHGGKKSIRVVDDGDGMNRDDVLLCLEQHATSKIATAEHLLAIESMGFRGEAVPAIASVSRMRISSRPADEPVGTTAQIDGGRMVRVIDAGLPKGTDIVVEDLFHNTPARRKFLKSPETELGHVVDTITQLAVTYPAVRFDLTSDGMPLQRVPASASVRERVHLILGHEAADFLVPVEGEADFLKVSGFAGRAAYTRGSTKSIFTYVNHRPVRDRLIHHAVLEAYRGRLLKGRYPVVVLFLDLPPHRVDVNVHPAKAEVRFRESSTVHEAIERVLKDALRAAGETVAPPPPAPTPEDERREGVRDAIHRYAQRTLSIAPPPRPPSPTLSVVPDPGEPTGATVSSIAPTSPRPDDPPGPALPATGPLRYIGQIADSYLVCQSEAGMVLVDQHAAHERVLFERLRRAHLAGGVPSQTLLFPVTIELTHREALLLNGVLADLESIGIGIEDYGRGTYVVKGLPRHLDEAACRELVRGIVDDLSTYDKTGKIDDLLDDAISRIACKAAVKAGQRLADREVGEVLEGLADADLPAHCPHGRPSFVVLSPAEMERMFLRR
jgi:DNA mismatch repair protein MutL